ncbi:MAG: ribosome small subunit-dependent GTPase A [Thermotogaceae bacterium]|nr:ribosome small subunit-dependent GTPase A [Thermotogaceae bacterium]
MRKRGIVVGFHSAMAVVEDLESEKRLMCKLRGKFKKHGIKVIVGDYVEYTNDTPDSGVIENILNRKSFLPKPKIANIDQVVLVTTIKEPEVPLMVLDKFLVLVENASLDVIIVTNKIDLITEDEKEKIEFMEKVYGKYYELIKTSAKTKEGIDKLREVFKGKVSAMAGMSGVGKSSLLNAVNPGLKLKVGEISEKLKRGKHTTTTTSLLRFDFGGYVADTPGFANLDISEIDPRNLKELFPEFREYRGMCAFPDCNHISEPGCYIRKLVSKGEIPSHRYENYLKMLKEIEKFLRVKEWSLRKRS